MLRGRGGASDWEGRTYTDELEEGGQLETRAEVTQSELEESAGTATRDVGKAEMKVSSNPRLNRRWAERLPLSRDGGSGGSANEDRGDLDHGDCSEEGYSEKTSRVVSKKTDVSLVKYVGQVQDCKKDKGAAMAVEKCYDAHTHTPRFRENPEEREG